MEKGSNAGGRRSRHKPGGSSSGGGSNKISDCDRTKSGNGRSSDSSGTRMQSARNPTPFLKKRSVRAKKKVQLSSQLGQAIAMLA
jgi:hypothetical protein